MQYKCNTMELALEKASKIICNSKLGLCPLREVDFAGCPWVCHEDIPPWRCWMVYLQTSVRLEQPVG